jgi:transcriptional regulator with XRE-family HTH domain
MNMSVPSDDDYPLARTAAANMLAEGLQRAVVEHGLNQRAVARKLGYKTSVALSHMALGRAPIPIERATDMARILDLDPSAFLHAVLKQRHPDVDFLKLLGAAPASATPTNDNYIVQDLEAIAGCPLEELSNERRMVLMEMLGVSDPSRRWLSVNELAVMEMIRRAFPAVATQPLDAATREKLKTALDNL